MLAGGCGVYVVTFVILYKRVNAMSFISKQNLLKLINIENKASPALRLDDVDISLPEVVSLDGRNSKVVLTSKLKGDEGSQVEVVYHRRPLADYIHDDNLFGNEDLTTTHSLLPLINERFKLNILPEDVEDNPIADVYHAVVANPKSHEWVGEVIVEIRPAAPLDTVLTKPDLDGFVCPDHQNAEIGQASVYSYPVNCTHISRFLNLLAVGVDIDDTALAVEMNKVVPEIWVAKPEACDWNLTGSRVIYDGSPKGKAEFNRAYTNVVSIELSNLCTNFQGTLNLHYNL